MQIHTHYTHFSSDVMFTLPLSTKAYSFGLQEKIGPGSNEKSLVSWGSYSEKYVVGGGNLFLLGLGFPCKTINFLIHICLCIR